MDIKELLALGKHRIRSEAKLLNQFIDFYEIEFGNRPSCSGCTFNKTFAQLNDKINKNINFKNYGIMENYKINARERSVIHSFVDPKTKKVSRSYGKNMTDEFAENFLKYGNESQIEERRKVFATLPKVEIKVKAKRKSKK